MAAQTCQRCGVISTLLPITEGTDFIFEAAFSNGAPVNPTAVSFVYQPGSGSQQVTLTIDDLANPSTGVFSTVIDTTGLTGNWILEVAGTGTCVASATVAMTVAPLPLGPPSVSTFSAASVVTVNSTAVGSVSAISASAGAVAALISAAVGVPGAAASASASIGVSAVAAAALSGFDYAFSSLSVSAVAIGSVGVSVTGGASIGVTSVAVGATSNLPGAPTGVTATPGDGAATVTWTAPASNGGSPITSYTVTAIHGGVPTTVVTGSASTTFTIPGLTNGLGYGFTVEATNAAGTGPASSVSNTLVAGAPLAPSGVTAAAGNASATVSWSAPTSNGTTIAGYAIIVYQGGVEVLSIGIGDVTSFVLDAANGCALTNGDTYTFTVEANARYGSTAAFGAPSAASNAVTPSTTTESGNASGSVGVSAVAVGSSSGGGSTYTPDIPSSYLSQIASEPVFYDDFAGTTLNSTKWNNTYQGTGGANVGVPTSAANVAVANGVTLKLASDGSSGGDIDTHGKFSFNQGYLQAIMTLPPDGHGHVANWGGLYTAVFSGSTGMSEIDINETLSILGMSDFSEEGEPRISIHGPASPGSNGPTIYSETIDAVSYGGSEHTYGVLWKGNVITFIFDGVVVGSSTSSANVSAQNHEIYITEGAGEQYAGLTVPGAGIQMAQIAFWPLASGGSYVIGSMGIEAPEKAPRRRHPIANAHHRRCRWGFHRFGEIHAGPVNVGGAALPAQTCLRCGLVSTLSPITEGSAFTWESGFFRAPGGYPTDPTTVAFMYQPGAARFVTLTTVDLVNIAIGVYTFPVDTTGLPGSWVLQTIGTGACSASASVALTVNPLSIGQLLPDYLDGKRWPENERSAFRHLRNVEMSNQPPV